MEDGGTELLRFETVCRQIRAWRASRRPARIPRCSSTTTAVFYWVMGAGEIARMKADPMAGAGGRAEAVIEPLDGRGAQRRRCAGRSWPRSAASIICSSAERRLRQGDLGRTGLPGGTDDTLRGGLRPARWRVTAKRALSRVSPRRPDDAVPRPEGATLGHVVLHRYARHLPPAARRVPRGAGGRDQARVADRLRFRQAGCAR